MNHRTSSSPGTVPASPHPRRFAGTRAIACALALAAPAAAQAVTATQLSCAPGLNPLNVTITPAAMSLVPGSGMNPAATFYVLQPAPLPAAVWLPPFPASCCGIGSMWYVPGGILVGPIVGATPLTPLVVPSSLYSFLNGTGLQVWFQAAAVDPSGFAPCMHITDAKRITF